MLSDSEVEDLILHSCDGMTPGDKGLVYSYIIQDTFAPDMETEFSYSKGHHQCPRCDSYYTCYLAVTDVGPRNTGWYCQDCYLLWNLDFIGLGAKCEQ